MTRDASSPGAVAAEVVLPRGQLDETLAFFVERLGFRLESIRPADEPTVAVVAGYGVRLRLEGDGAPGALRLRCDDPRALAPDGGPLRAPNGTRIDVAPAEEPLAAPPLVPSFVLSRAADATWKRGRAGMEYRDLVPGGQGGRFVVSQIRIPGGGPVPDYVHFHAVRLQFLYCTRGWVRVVYEDQGPPFVLRAGDGVLQPPRIRHRVLECSPGLEVFEIGSPADHATFADHGLALPTDALRPERDFGGQRFLRWQPDGAIWRPWRCAGFESRDTGLAEATRGLAGAHVVRAADAAGDVAGGAASHDAELVFALVLTGSATLRVDGRADEPLGAGDAFAVPARQPYALGDAAGLELLEVALPAAFETRGDARDS